MSPDFEVPQVNREAKIKIPDCDVGYKLKVGVDKQVICIGCWGGGKESTVILAVLIWAQQDHLRLSREPVHSGEQPSMPGPDTDSQSWWEERGTIEWS